MRYSFLIAAFLPVAALAAGPSTEVFQRPHELLVQAIQTGHAEGVMRGAVADKFTQQFRSNGVLAVKADVIGTFPRQDCKRLNVVYTKHDVMTPTGPRNYDLGMKLNYCLDGRPPMDLEAKK